jgi:predicted ATP-binding protein involved in virulence
MEYHPRIIEPSPHQENNRETEVINYYVSGESLKSNNDQEGAISYVDFLLKIQDTEGVYVWENIIPHGLPKELPLWENYLSGLYAIKKKDQTKDYLTRTELSRLIASATSGIKTNTNFLNAFLFVLAKEDKTYKLDELYDHFAVTSKHVALELAKYLKTYTEVSDVRLSSSFHLVISEDSSEITFRNLFFEFFSNNNWYSFEQLSDGTKRIVYIISEIIDYALLSNRPTSHTILIEEPELGIHPHLLHKLMSFLKDQSADKQLIITTHSPQVLDILGKDELDRIIVCKYDSEKGTQLNHLSTQEITKAQLYMEEDFLSDYWRFSDLEK